MLVVPAGGEPVLLDFFVAAPGCDADLDRRAPLVAADVSFGDVVQVFHIGAARAAPTARRPGVRRRRALGHDAARRPRGAAAALARDGVEVNTEQAYVFEILAPIYSSTPGGARAVHARGAGAARRRRALRPELADSLERLGTDEARRRSTRATSAPRSATACAELGGTLTTADLAAYEADAARPGARPLPRARGADQPAAERRRHAARLRAGPARAHARPARSGALVDVMEKAQAERTPEFLERLAEPGFLERFMAGRLGSHHAHLGARRRRLGVQRHVHERRGLGRRGPGTGVHVNNMMGEQDLSPLGFFHHPPGRRLPSMMAPTVVLAAGAPELALGSRARTASARRCSR